MAFIEPMHRNKPNITYLLTSYDTPGPRGWALEDREWRNAELRILSLHQSLH